MKADPASAHCCRAPRGCRFSLPALCFRGFRLLKDRRRGSYRWRARTRCERGHPESFEVLRNPHDHFIPSAGVGWRVSKHYDTPSSPIATLRHVDSRFRGNDDQASTIRWRSDTLGIRGVRVARVHVLPLSYYDYDEHLSSPSISVAPSATSASSAILITSLVIPASSLVIPAKAGIHRSKRYASPIRNDLPDSL
jgi:hypothetical protein